MVSLKSLLFLIIIIIIIILQLSVISGLHVGPKLTTTSALDGLAVLSEAKGNMLQVAIIVL